ncbi:hypothetical protein [Thalassobellus suaedae]|uniref:Uncharacterized protein n=1 Tax=Thalassobellus suaedae TaxID=3074124 RepID=A0ABY9XW63_9FLAO|nr:hypothetical protein RHP51_04885 [Flavobacteriaceae bacterium HL-DH14]
MIKTFDLKDKDQTKQYVLRLFGVSIWALCNGNGIGWMRIFGKGIHWKDTTRHRLYFPERNGYRKALKIGNWRLSYLP